MIFPFIFSALEPGIRWIVRRRPKASNTEAIALSNEFLSWNAERTQAKRRVSTKSLLSTTNAILHKFITNRNVVKNQIQLHTIIKSSQSALLNKTTQFASRIKAMGERSYVWYFPFAYTHRFVYFIWKIHYVFRCSIWIPICLQRALATNVVDVIPLLPNEPPKHTALM